MKAKIFAVAALLALNIAAFAQSNNTNLTPIEISGELYSIPGQLTIDGNAIPYTTDKPLPDGPTSLTVYDNNLNVVRTLSIPLMEGEKLEYGSELPDRSTDEYFDYNITQNLFNNDEKIEFVVKTGNGYKIIDENGHEIFHCDYLNFIRLDGKTYYIEYVESGRYNLYLINDTSSNGIAGTRIKTQETFGKAYHLSGVPARDGDKGVIIKDGVKYYKN